MWKNDYKQYKFPSNIDEIQSEKADQLLKKHMPTLLYKYREVNLNSIKSLLRDSIWISLPREMNDPHECSFYCNFEDLMSSDEYLSHDIVKKLIKRLKLDVNKFKNMELHEIILELALNDPNIDGDVDKAYAVIDSLKTVSKKNQKEIMDSLEYAMKNYVYIFSLSENCHNNLMWSHYGDSHKGFCIEYDFNSVETDNIIKKSLKPVVYTNEKIDFAEYFKAGIKRFPELMSFPAMIKSKDWEYEQEWRLIYPQGPEAEPFEGKSPKIRSIILGSNISKNDEELLVKLANDKRINVDKMVRTLDSYKLVRKPLNNYA